MISITISSLRKADSHLADGTYNGMVSIGKPVNREHATLRTGNDLLLEFDDVTPNQATRKPLPPTSEIIRLIEWGKTAQGKILVHCKAGRSRSTASGMILYRLAGLSDDEAAQQLYNVAPRSKPNWYILVVADALLGTNLFATCRMNGYRLKTTRRDITKHRIVI